MHDFHGATIPTRCGRTWNSQGGETAMNSCIDRLNRMDHACAGGRPDVGFDGEPSLDEMLDDPVIQAVMIQDGVGRQDIVDLVASLQSAFFR